MVSAQVGFSNPCINVAAIPNANIIRTGGASVGGSGAGLGRSKEGSGLDGSEESESKLPPPSLHSALKKEIRSKIKVRRKRKGKARERYTPPPTVTDDDYRRDGSTGGDGSNDPGYIEEEKEVRQQHHEDVMEQVQYGEAEAASVGDTITLELTVTEALSALPVVTIAGQLADTVTGSGLSFSATRTVVETDVSGAAGHVASFVDLAGNGGVAGGDTTDGSAVVISTGTSVDSTAPQLISVSIASDNSNPGMATVGNTISIVSTASEPLEAATVTIAGRAAEVSWVGDGGAGAVSYYAFTKCGSPRWAVRV